MKKKGVLAAWLLVLSLLLAACGGFSEADAKALVQGNLDEIYLDKADAAYLKMVNATAEEAHQVYEDGLDVEVEVFMTCFGILDDTEARREEIKELFRQIYAHSTYRVGEAEKQDDGSYIVPVEVDPLDIFSRLAAEGMETAIFEAFAAYSEDELMAMSDAEYEVLWADTVLGVCRENLADISTLDTVTVEIVVAPDSNDVWGITEDSLGELDEYVISYP